MSENQTDSTPSVGVPRSSGRRGVVMVLFAVLGLGFAGSQLWAHFNPPSDGATVVEQRVPANAYAVATDPIPTRNTTFNQSGGDSRSGLISNGEDAFSPSAFSGGDPIPSMGGEPMSQTRQTASAQFDSEQRRFQAQIDAMKKRLAQLEARLKRRASRRDQIIRQKLNQSQSGSVEGPYYDYQPQPPTRNEPAPVPNRYGMSSDPAPVQLPEPSGDFSSQMRPSVPGSSFGQPMNGAPAGGPFPSIGNAPQPRSGQGSFSGGDPVGSPELPGPIERTSIDDLGMAIPGMADYGNQRSQAAALCRRLLVVETSLKQLEEKKAKGIPDSPTITNLREEREIIRDQISAQRKLINLQMRRTTEQITRLSQALQSLKDSGVSQASAVAPITRRIDSLRAQGQQLAEQSRQLESQSATEKVKDEFMDAFGDGHTRDTKGADELTQPEEAADFGTGFESPPELKTSPEDSVDPVEDRAPDPPKDSGSDINT